MSLLHLDEFKTKQRSTFSRSCGSESHVGEVDS